MYRHVNGHGSSPPPLSTPPPHASSGSPTRVEVMRHYPGKAIDVSLSLEHSNAMGALYEANWTNAHQELLMMRSPNTTTTSTPLQRNSYERRQQLPQPECHSPPTPKFQETTTTNTTIIRHSQCSPSHVAVTAKCAPSSLSKYQITLEQIRALEEKNANITRTICDLNGYKPSTLRRKPRRHYPEWNDLDRMRNEDDGPDNNRPSDLVSEFLRSKNNKLNATKLNLSLQATNGDNAERLHTPIDQYHCSDDGDFRKSSSSGSNSSVLDKDSLEGKSPTDEVLDCGEGKPPLHHRLRNPIKFCGGTIDIKDIFRRKKEPAKRNSPLPPKEQQHNHLPGRIVASNGKTDRINDYNLKENFTVGRKIYPKTINLTKNLARDPVVLDVRQQPACLAAEKHKSRHYHHHLSHPNLYHSYELVENSNNTDNGYGTKQQDCDIDGTAMRSTRRSGYIDHDYEIIDYDRQWDNSNMDHLTMSAKKKTAIGRAKSVRISPLTDAIQQQPLRSPSSSLLFNRNSMPPLSYFSAAVSPSLSPAAVAPATTIDGRSSSSSNNAAVRRSKSVNPNSFAENAASRNRVMLRRQGESDYENIVPRRPKVVAALVKAKGSSGSGGTAKAQVVAVSPNKSKSPSQPPPMPPVAYSVDGHDDEFSIPRPRLIAPVHSYARKRRTGNLRSELERQLGDERCAKDASGNL